MPEPTPESRQLSFLVTKSARVVTRLYQRELMPYGISLPPALVLGMLHLHGPLTQSAIGTLLYMDKASLSSAIRHLRDRKLIETGEVEGDARLALHRLTESGQNLAVQLVALSDRLENQLLEMAPPETVEQAKTFLAAILKNDNYPLD